ncbi:cilia- and flagella-associated protein 100 isoform X1 [Ictalurus punctatus]|uniref:Cilia- and flagella-associated protein 100 isoform X1 n=1 Tax=Ictalurus punctatus TaxID=7998 RepID=A0A2D0RYY3_ICTPU|nr:cilia- and flagella-associated protein 100 isoform X1 [Ictalurus punctatus]
MLSAAPSVKENGHDGNRTEQNPFKMPEDNTIFHFRKTEKARRKQEYQRDLSLSVSEKKTYSGKIKARQLDLRKKLRDGLEDKEEATTHLSQTEVQLPQNAPASKVIMIKDRNIEKESIREFINKKREMFYLEYALAVKREEIAQLEEQASREEKKLAKAEKLLEDDAALFDTFLKENDKNSVEAIRIAEQESKAKMEKVAEIKRITAKMVAIKSNISKLEDTLQEYKLYKDFLFKISPPEWQEKQRAKKKHRTKSTSAINKEEHEGKSRETDRAKKTRQSDRHTGREKRSPVSRELPPLRETWVHSRHSIKSTPQGSKISSASESDSSEYEEEPELYFTEPQQLLNLLSELEEQNLFLIQNSQETEESLEEFRQTMEQTRKNIEQEANHLKQQIDAMTETLMREKEKTAELELNTRFFDFGKSKAEEESALNALGQKVEEVYRSCIGDSETNLSTLQMLMAIESRLGDLLESVELIPADHLAVAERAKEKERRLRLRDEKLIQQKQHQEERIKKAMERAQAEIKRTSGKKLMPRSQPPVRKLKSKEHSDITDEEKEEYLYFFT